MKSKGCFHAYKCAISRYKVHDFAHITEIRGLTILFRQPDLATDIFSPQYNVSLWAHLGLLILTLLIVMHLMGYIERQHIKKRKEDIGVNEQRDVSFGMLDGISWCFCKTKKFVTL